MKRILKHPKKKYHPSDSGLYRHFADYYDLLFTGLFQAHIDRTIRAVQVPAGARVLEVGVGTGMSLSSYPRGASVVGIDLSQEMLDLAARKHQGAAWGHVELRQMDAQRLLFANESFDFVMAFHVLSVVPDPQQAMQEMVRVCRPQGQVVIINHFRSRNRQLARFVDSLNPLTKRLGWRSDLRIDELLSDMPVSVRRFSKTSAGSIFTVLTLTKEQDGKEQAARRRSSAASSSARDS